MNEKINKIRKIMLGHIPINVSIVVITPLPSTFYKLSKKLDIEETYDNGFFGNCTFRIHKNDKRGILVLSPQGISSKDIIELFSNTNILFFGLAGSLNNEYKIGNFVEVETAEDEYGNITKLSTTGKYEKVKCGYSPCLLGKIEKRYCEFAKKENCDVVDMETTYCAKTASEKNNKFVSLLLISDIPKMVNFWELSGTEAKKLKEGRKYAIDEIVNYINVLIKE